MILRCLLTQNAAFCFYLALAAHFLLRRAWDIRVWQVMMGALISSDLSYLGALQVSSPGVDICWNMWLWRVEDWHIKGLGSTLLGS